MSEAYKKIVRLWVEEVLNKGNLSVLDELVHPNYVCRSPNEVPNGPEAIKGRIAKLRTAFPDLTARVDEMLIDGDKSVQCFTMTGTHEGNFRGIAATGKKVTLNGMVVSRFEEGKIIEEWEIVDQLALLQQLGVSKIPAH